MFDELHIEKHESGGCQVDVENRTNYVQQGSAQDRSDPDGPSHLDEKRARDK